jgi:predicted metalloprotease with PDZ domain
LQFDLPDGVAISAPWPLLERHQGRAVYRLVDTPTRWPARMAIGRFPVRELEIGGARLRLAVIAGTPAADNEAVAGWLEESAAAVATLYGRFPLPQAQLLVVPLGPQSEPVPWGQVLRGGGPAAHLFIDQTRPDNEWRADWTAVHELSHMLMPYISRHDAWLSEGFASYYQNVLRARAGMISEADAWRKLTAGFERGRKGTRPGVTLSAASRQMRREQAFMRVYWSGAAIALLADMRLREAGDGLSLDVALSRLAECCLPSNRMWTARQALDRLDSLTGTDVFARLGERYRDSDEFPDVAPLLDALGVIGQGEALRFDDSARLATSRRTLMGAPNPASVQR